MSVFRQYVKNAVILVGASLFMRTVSLLFNAYVSGKMGAEGMGLFSLSMSVYGFAVTFATSGIQLAVTRLCAEAIGRDRPGEVGAIVRRALLYALFFGGTAALCLFVFATPIGVHLLRDVRTVPSLRLMSVSMVPIAFASVLSGYFSAVRRVSRTAATQLFEQGIRIALTVYGLMALLPAGLEYACLALVGGSALAEFFSFFFLLVAYLIDRRRARTFPSAKGQGLFRRMAGISMPVAFSAYIRSGLVTVEHILIPICLAAGGAGRGEALASYGVLHSMAIPVVLYPAAISGAFAGLLVPEMAESLARGERERIRYMTGRALSATLLFSVLCAGVLSACSYEIGEIFYGSQEAGVYIRRMAPVVVIMYLDTVIDCILKGLGHQVYTMGVNIADSLLSLGLVLLFLPRMGAVGYVYVVMLAELFNFSLSLFRLLQTVPLRLPLFRFVLVPLLSVVGATCIVRLLLPTGGTPYTLFAHILMSAVIYLLFLWVMGALQREDVSYLRGVLPLSPNRKNKKTYKNTAK